MPTLFDAFTRQQIYLEGVKLEQMRVYTRINSDVADVITATLATVQKDTLGQLTRRELIRLSRRLNKAVRSLTNDYTAGVQGFLAKLVEVSGTIAAAIMEDDTDVPLAEQKKRRDFIPIFGWPSLESDRELWRLIQAEVVPATGLQVKQMVEVIDDMIATPILNRLAMGYANNETPKAVTRAIVGTDTLFNRDGVLARIVGNIGTWVGTLIQSVSTFSGNNTASAYTARYQWVSVIDSKTSDICRSRNGNVYEYPNDPVPPAHPNCRSHTVPITQNDPVPEPSLPETLMQWLRTQPAQVQEDVGPVVNSGRFLARRPLTLAEYASKVKMILFGS
jgi:hypothetical protein